jgi:hypothetical protein
MLLPLATIALGVGNHLDYAKNQGDFVYRILVDLYLLIHGIAQIASDTNN